jgi:anthranilate synthase component 2
MKNQILVIDNYDSFTYNLVHYLEALNCEVTVLRNNEVTIEDTENYNKILLSPGPGIPSEAGNLLPVLKACTHKSILGICLGQQAIAEVFGGSLINLKTVYHGVAATIKITAADETLFSGLGNKFSVGRYHSWSVSPITLPDVLEVTSTDESGNIMSIRHKELDIKGVQFHPESILTPNGKHILNNWINIK